MSSFLDLSGVIDPIEHALGVCHVLGAGFSHACCDKYPVSVGFLAGNSEIELGIRFGNTLPRTDEYAWGLLARLEEAYGPLEEVNVEEVMTDLYTRGFGLGGAWEWDSQSNYSVEAARRDYRGLLHYIWNKLFLLGRNTDRSPLAKEFLSIVRTQDSLVSLNYDLLIESHLLRGESEPPDPRIAVLSRLIGAPDVEAGASRPGTLEYLEFGHRGVFVKLHGSADWYSCANPECPFHGYMTPGWLTRNDTRDTCWGRCTVCGSGIEAAIVPPTHAKPFDRFPKVRLMWWRAFNALIHARRWTFIGTSLAPADFHLSSLIRSSSRASTCFHPTANGGQICVVNKDGDSARQLGERIYRLLAPTIQRRVLEGAVKITPFGSVRAYLDATVHADADRVDAHGGVC